jgi:hypothetical protein
MLSPAAESGGLRVARAETMDPAPASGPVEAVLAAP